MANTMKTYHESYGWVTPALMRAIRKHNVSPADYRELEDFYGAVSTENDFNADVILDTITNESWQQGGSFSTFLWNTVGNGHRSLRIV